MRYLVLSDIHANLEALEAVLARTGALRRPAPFWCSATWSATAPIRTPSSIGCGLCAARRLSGETTTRSPPASRAPRTSTTWRARRLAGRPTNSPTRTSSTCDLLPIGPMVVSDLIEICHGAPFDEDAYIVSDRHAAGRSKPHRVRSVSSGTRTFRLRPASTPMTTSAWWAAGRSWRARFRSSRRALPHQPRFGRPAARRRSACVVRRRRHRSAVGGHPPRRLPRRAGPGEDRRRRPAGAPRQTTVDWPVNPSPGPMGSS